MIRATATKLTDLGAVAMLDSPLPSDWVAVEAVTLTSFDGEELWHRPFGVEVKIVMGREVELYGAVYANEFWLRARRVDTKRFQWSTFEYREPGPLGFLDAPRVLLLSEVDVPARYVSRSVGVTPSHVVSSLRPNHPSVPGQLLVNARAELYESELEAVDPVSELLDGEPNKVGRLSRSVFEKYWREGLRAFVDG